MLSKEQTKGKVKRHNKREKRQKLNNGERFEKSRKSRKIENQNSTMRGAECFRKVKEKKKRKRKENIEGKSIER